MMIVTVHSILVEVFSESLFELLTFGIFLFTLLFKYFSWVFDSEVWCMNDNFASSSLFWYVDICFIYD